MGMTGKQVGMAVAVGLALCASPSFSAAQEPRSREEGRSPLPQGTATADLVKISIRVPEGTPIGDKLGRTEEFARVLLGAMAQADYLPSSSIADKRSVLRYQAARWNPAATPSRREQARAGLLELWGPALTIESPDIQVRPDPLQALSAYLQPKKEAVWKPAFQALGLVNAPALRAGDFNRAYDNGRAEAKAPPVIAAGRPVIPHYAAAVLGTPRAAIPVLSQAKKPIPLLAQTAPERPPAAGTPSLPEQKPDLYEGIIVPIADEYGISPDVIRAIVDAKSNCGSGQQTCGRNLMGISAGVANAYGYKAKDILDPAVNIRVGTRLLAELLKQFKGDLHRALAAYQAGPAAVFKSRGIPNDPGVKAFLGAFQKSYRGALPRRSVQAVVPPNHSVVKEVAAEIQETVAELVEESRGNPKVARYRPLIQKTAQLVGVDADLMEAMVMQENPWGNPKAVSPKGAVGLGQLMPGTAAMLGVKDSTDPAQNLKGMAKHLKYLLDNYGGNKVLAVAAYNAGEGAVDRVNRVPNYKETKAYVTRVMGFYRELTGVTIDPTPYMPPTKRPVRTDKRG
jgi:soluble lytic murein transglycosylase-like protein